MSKKGEITEKLKEGKKELTDLRSLFTFMQATIKF